MSDKQPIDSQTEEVDLGQLFNAIGRLFEKLFAFIGRIFKGIFSLIIYALKPFVVHFKIVAPILVLAAILGYVYDILKAPVYVSDMVVRPYFDSKYQLNNNIDYFNSLISTKNLTELSNIFEIDTAKASQLLGFKLEAGPETQNDLFLEYDEYLKSVDTSLVDELSYIGFIQNRDLLSGGIFTIEAKALKADIFNSLEEGFKKTFENEFSTRLKARRDTIAQIERQTLTTQLRRLDSIQMTYLRVIENESKKGDLSLGIEGLIPLQEEKTTTKEYELFREEQKIRRALQNLEQELAEENTYFDVVSGFDRVGEKDKSLEQRFTLIFPLLALVLMSLIILASRTFTFIKNYE
jgi:hypothetical protein